MHEIGIIKNIFELVLREIQKAGPKKVNGKHLVIGELTGTMGE